MKLGFISFGGPAGQIAIMHEKLVERRRWISEERFLHALNFCMLLPGPEAQQLATYIGWLLHGTRGGLVAGTLFVLPSAVILWALSYAYVTFGTLPVAAGLLGGLKLAVLAIGRCRGGADWREGGEKRDDGGVGGRGVWRGLLFESAVSAAGLWRGVDRIFRCPLAVAAVCGAPARMRSRRRRGVIARRRSR